METAVTRIEKCSHRLTERGLELPDVMTFEEWEGIGEGLKYLVNVGMYALGDWLVYGEEHFGERYAQAMDSTELAYQTLRNVAWTCRNVDQSVRRVQTLTFSHHTEVAKFMPDEQLDWLRRAEENQWTRNELRDQILLETSPPKEDEPKGKPDYKQGLKLIRDEVSKYKMSAVPKARDIEVMMLIIQNVKQILKEHGE